MKPIYILALFLAPIFLSNITAQVSYTANTQAPALSDDFRYGVNPGWFQNWGNLDTPWPIYLLEFQIRELMGRVPMFGGQPCQNGLSINLDTALEIMLLIITKPWA